MEIRVLRYFLTVAKEQSFTKAAEVLHITQPTLSRQLAGLEKELGVTLFDRSGHHITLTDEGLLLKRRALEIVDMEEKIVDIGLFLEPVSTENLDYIRLPGSDHWVVAMKADDPLAKKDEITKADLKHLPLILPERTNVQSELANWFGKDFQKLHIVATSNLGTNAGVLALEGIGYPISIEGAVRYWREDLLVQKRLSPAIQTSTVIAWRRNIPCSPAVECFIKELNAYKA